MRDIIHVFIVTGLLCLGFVSPLAAEVIADSAIPVQKAEGEKLSIATGHYSRARSLLIAAIREFDEGLKVVNPDALLDSQAFRASLLERSKDLERVLDPQPRVSKSGVRYQPDSRLLGGAKGK